MGLPAPRMENLCLIVGLGNPGSEYARTRHNAGFLVVERLAERWQAAWSLERKFNARLARAERGGRRVLLVEPQTFMNASGEAVGAVAEFYQVPADQIARGGGRCGFAAGRTPVATGWQQRRSSRPGVHRTTFEHAGLCAAAGRDRPPAGRPRDYRLRAGSIWFDGSRAWLIKFWLWLPTRPSAGWTPAYRKQ